MLAVPRLRQPGQAHFALATFLPTCLGWTGLVVSVLYFVNQGDIMRTAIPDFPVAELAGAIGSTAWGLWVAALGITLLVRRPATAGPTR